MGAVPLRTLTLLALLAATGAAPVRAAPAEASATLRLEAVRVVGNTRTSAAFIEGVLDVPAGQPFSEVAAERGRLRLLSLGFFLDVTLRLEKGSRRGDVVLVAEVEERPTVVVNDLTVGVDGATGWWGGADLAEASLFGTGVGASLAFVAGDDQQAFRLRVSDPAVFGSHFSASVAALLVNGAEPLVGPEPGSMVRAGNGPAADYARLRYRRAGALAGAGLALTGFTSVFADYRFEHVRADAPPTLVAVAPDGGGQELTPGLPDGDGRLSTVSLTLLRDSRNDAFLPTAGTFSLLAAELSHRALGATWDFARLRGHHDRYLHLGRGHALRLGVAAGLVLGDAPFFERFFVGDLHDLVPSRALGVNYSIRRPPDLLGSTLPSKRYEEVFGRLGVEYTLPLTQGRGRFFYRSDFFVSLGLVGLASREDLRDLGAAAGRPLDLTADVGLRFDTPIGLFALSLANLLELVPLP